MNWMRYLNHDMWQTSQIDRFEERMRSLRRQSSSSNARIRDDVDELYDDLGRTVLLLHSFMQACIRKGLLTKEDIVAVAEELDLADGVKDGKLAPERVRPPDERERESRRPRGVNDNLRDLERQEIDSPEDFLRDLEDET